MVELKPGDFLYQSDQELFLVVIDEEEDHYLFAAHGWRKIDKERLEDYLENDRSKVHHQSEIEKLVEEQGDDGEQETFKKLRKLFAAYKDADLVENGPQSDFALDDT